MSSKFVIKPNMNDAIEVIRHAGQWMSEADLHPSPWWRADNLSVKFFEPYAKPTEFFVVYVNTKPAATAIIQEHQTLQDWSAVDGNNPPKAMYIHYVAVEREYAGQGLPRVLIDYAGELARQRQTTLLRLDTNADEHKLCALYEGLGFQSVMTLEEDGGRTVLYEKRVGEAVRS